MAQLAEAEGGVSLHTEAQSIRDWKSVCDHIIKRASGITVETDQFLKLFHALTQTYKQYRDMCDNMRTIITTQKEYIEVPDYHETAIHQGCDLIQQCIDTMYNAYNELFERLVDVCNDTISKQEEWNAFVNDIVPYTQDTQQLYLEKENELQTTMHVYMQAAEHNDRGFFIVAKQYQKQLLEFQKTLKTSTDSMQDVISKVQSIENEKKEFETSIERDFIERVLTKQAEIQNVFGCCLQKLESLNGANAWDILTSKLGLYKEDGSTIFEDPVPNKAGALIKSWMERDMEMTANIRLGSQSSLEMFMIVTRWGFVQIYKDSNDIQPNCEFYLYDYKVNIPNQMSLMDDELTTRLSVRQHQTFAPLRGLTPNYVITFQELEAKNTFDGLITEFQATHAPQT
eukprot:222046_1